MTQAELQERGGRMSTDYRTIIITTKKGKIYTYTYDDYDWRFVDDKLIVKTVMGIVVLILAREEFESIEIE